MIDAYWASGKSFGLGGYIRFICGKSGIVIASGRTAACSAVCRNDNLRSGVSGADQTNQNAGMAA